MNYKDLLIGFVPSTVSKTATCPFDMAKVRLQIDDGKYTGTFDCISQIARQEGPWALMKGNLAGSLKYFPIQITTYYVNSLMNKYVYPDKKQFNTPNKQLFHLVFFGSISASISMFLFHPIEVIRTRMMADVAPKDDTKGFLDHLTNIYLEDGIRGFYRGLSLSVIGLIPYRLIFYTGYEYFKSVFLTSKSTFLIRCLVSQLTAIISQLIFYPLDTIRRYQMVGGLSTKDGRGRYPELNVWDTFLYIIEKKGIFGVYHGYPSSLIQTILSSTLMTGISLIIDLKTYI